MLYLLIYYLLCFIIWMLLIAWNSRLVVVCNTSLKCHYIFLKLPLFLLRSLLSAFLLLFVGNVFAFSGYVNVLVLHLIFSYWVTPRCDFNYFHSWKCRAFIIHRVMSLNSFEKVCFIFFSKNGFCHTYLLNSNYVYVYYSWGLTSLNCLQYFTFHFFIFASVAQFLST